MGLEAGEAPELWNESEPGKVRALYDGAIGAGSDLFLTNSFGGNASRLKLHEAEGRVFELNRIAAEIAREAADAAGRPVVVAGSMGPTGEIMAPLGPLTDRGCRRDVRGAGAGPPRRGRGRALGRDDLGAGGVPRRRPSGSRRTGAPWCGTMSFDTAGRTMMGLTAADMVALVGGLPHRPLAFGANCGVGASDLLRTVLGFARRAPGPAGDRQGQRRHPEVPRRPYPLRRHAGADGRLCGARPRLRGEDHRRLLRHDARAPRCHACGARGDAARAARRSSTPSPRGSAASRPPRTARAARHRPASAAAAGHEGGARRPGRARRARARAARRRGADDRRSGPRLHRQLRRGARPERGACGASRALRRDAARPAGRGRSDRGGAGLRLHAAHDAVRGDGRRDAGGGDRSAAGRRGSTR